MGLFDKIYEAIDNGIQKALIIDNGQDNDVSVKFHHNKIDNNINMWNFYVNELLTKNSDLEYAYDQVIRLYNEKHCRYKCNDIDEMIMLFNKIKNFDTIGNVFKWMDTSALNFCSFILDNDEEILLEDYTDDMNPVFLKISNEELKAGNNDILIYIPDKHYISNKHWQEYDNTFERKYKYVQSTKYLIKDYKTVKNDYNGYEICQRITKGKKTGILPAIEYCMDQHINGHDGYLPSAGQLEILFTYIDFVNDIFKSFNTYILDISNVLTDYWVSNEYSLSHAWAGCYSKNSKWYGLDNYLKTNNFIVIPFFKKIKF